MNKVVAPKVRMTIQRNGKQEKNNRRADGNGASTVEQRRETRAGDRMRTNQDNTEGRETRWNYKLTVELRRVKKREDWMTFRRRVYGPDPSQGLALAWRKLRRTTCVRAAKRDAWVDCQTRQRERMECQWSLQVERLRVWRVIRAQSGQFRGQDGGGLLFWFTRFIT